MISVPALLLLSVLSVHGQGPDLKQLRETILQKFRTSNGSVSLPFSEEVHASSSSDDDEKEDVEFTEFQLEALEAHNLYRAKHGVPPMELSKEICSHAQEWADKLLAENTLGHSGVHEYGENIDSSWSSNPEEAQGNVAVDNWYDEGKQYTFGQEPMGGPVTGHFTQVVWKESKQLGIAVAQKNGQVIVVGNYYPPGNIIGEYTPNVPAPVSQQV